MQSVEPTSKDIPLDVVLDLDDQPTSNKKEDKKKKSFFELFTSCFKRVANTSRPTKQVIVVRDDLKMRKGKLGAQVGHAVAGFLHEIIETGRMYTPAEYQWVNVDNRKKVVLAVNSEADLLKIVQASQEAGITTHLVTDNGLTEFNGVPTNTCVAIGPDYADKMEDFVGKESPMWLEKRLRLY